MGREIRKLFFGRSSAASVLAIFSHFSYTPGREPVPMASGLPSAARMEVTADAIRRVCRNPP